MHTYSVLLRIVAVALLLYSLFLFASTAGSLSDARLILDRAQAQMAALEQEKATYEQRIGSLENERYMEALARERLGLVRPGEKVFYFTSESTHPEKRQEE